LARARRLAATPWRLPHDIDIEGPGGPVPLSRGAKERALGRSDRYDRRARLLGCDELTATGTVRMTFQVTDDEPFSYDPGQFIGIRHDVPEKGLCRTPYCIVSPPNAEKTFQLLVRMVPEGPLSIYLGSLEVGDVIAFRGPSGRSMIPKKEYDELVLMATGVGVGPFIFLMRRLTADGSAQPVRLFWGVRLTDDVCLVDELDELAEANPHFTYQLSLSQPPPTWTGLRGRITESVPPLIPKLGDKRFYLVGNGVMTEEMSSVLSDLGVDREFIYQEPFFNTRHKADPAVVAAIRQRFVAADLFSPATDGGALLRVEKPVGVRRQQSAGLGPD
jgi:ferredoxin-NADP reductase